MLPALMFLASMQPAMTSMGDIRNNIEFNRRLLDETRVDANVLVWKKMSLSRCHSEHMYLAKRIESLEKTEERLRDEIGRLMVTAFWAQVCAKNKYNP